MSIHSLITSRLFNVPPCSVSVSNLFNVASKSVKLLRFLIIKVLTVFGKCAVSTLPFVANVTPDKWVPSAYNFKRLLHCARLSEPVKLLQFLISSSSSNLLSPSVNDVRRALSYPSVVLPKTSFLSLVAIEKLLAAI